MLTIRNGKADPAPTGVEQDNYRRRHSMESLRDSPFWRSLASSQNTKTPGRKTVAERESDAGTCPVVRRHQPESSGRLATAPQATDGLVDARMNPLRPGPQVDDPALPPPSRWRG